MVNFNLSYDSLTGYKARQKLCDLKTTDPDFWAELTQKATVKLIVHPNEVVAEDEDTVDPLFKDNSDLPCEAIITNITDSSPAGVASTSNGDMMLTAAAESLDDNEMEIPDDSSMGTGKLDLGCGKRKRTANKLYNTNSFWRHNNDDTSDQE